MLSLIKRKAPANQPDKNAGAPGTETDSSSPVELVARMREVCRAATTGDIEQRITNIEPANELAELAWDINALLDIVDSYTRETSASMASASEGKCQRRQILPQNRSARIARRIQAIKRSNQYCIRHHGDANG